MTVLWIYLIGYPHYTKPQVGSQKNIFDKDCNIFKNVSVVFLGGNTNNLRLGPLDGISQCDFLFRSKHITLPKRNHILHNIDDIFGYEAVREGSYKLVKGILSK